MESDIWKKGLYIIQFFIFDLSYSFATLDMCSTVSSEICNLYIYLNAMESIGWENCYLLILLALSP